MSIEKIKRGIYLTYIGQTMNGLAATGLTILAFFLQSSLLLCSVTAALAAYSAVLFNRQFVARDEWKALLVKQT